jgi:hypothetical protein
MNMSTRTVSSILLTALLLGGIAIGLGWVLRGLEIFGWLVVIAVIVMLVMLWWPRNRTEKS